MPVVPYSGVPSVAPQMDATPRYTADVSPNTFGANVGAAISHLGDTVAGAGNEIFARGVAMQDLYNHSAAQDASAKFMEAAGDLHAKLTSMQGADAVDYYANGFKTDLESARSSFRSALPNPMAQKLYDSESRGFSARVIFSGATHAAEANRRYAVGASQAKVDALANSALGNPRDDDAFDDSISDSEDEVRAQGAIQGLPSAQIDNNVAQTKSRLWSARLQGLVRTDPFRAGKLYAQAKADGEIVGKDDLDLNNLIQEKQLTVGARNISQQALAGTNLRWGAKPVDLPSAREAIAGNEADSRGYATVGPETRSLGHALGRYQVMSASLSDWLSEAGLPAMSEAEFLHNPKAQDALFNSKFGSYQEKYGSFNAAAVAWFAGEGRAANPAKWSDTSITDATATTKGHTIPWYLTKANATLAQSAPLAAKVSMAQDLARAQSPDNPLLPDAVQTRVETDAAHAARVTADTNERNRLTVAGALMDDSGGKLPTTLDELTSDPKVSAAWQSLGPDAKATFLGGLQRNAKADVVETPDTLRETQRLKGQAETDPKGFLAMDIPGLALPLTDRRALITLQETKRKSADADPNVTRAIGILRPTLDAAGLTRKDRPQDYDTFLGALRDAMHESAQREGAQPKDEAILQMGTRLLQPTGPSGWFSPAPSVFNAPIPSDLLNSARSARPDLSDAQLQRAYTRRLYRDLANPSPMTEKRS